MKYKMITQPVGTYGLEQFNREINEFLDKGWELHGETKIINFEHMTNESYFFQAIIWLTLEEEQRKYASGRS